MKNKKLALIITALVLIIGGGISAAVIVSNNKKEEEEIPFVPKFISFPAWAVDDLKFYHPNNLEQDLEKSVITSIKADPNAFDSFIFVYKPNLEIALKQAGIFANRYELTKNEELSLSEGVEIRYDNLLVSEEVAPYIVIIQVNKDGTLTMSAINRSHIR